MAELSLNESKVKSKAFMGQMISIINGGALSLMISIGHKTGLFDIMDGSPPATSDEISISADLDERYVREWLSALSCGGILEHDSTAGTFFLPPEHAGLLTRRSGPLNLAIPLQMIPLLGEVEEDIVDVFKNGGGVPYDRYPRFQELMAETSNNRFDRTLLKQIVPILPVEDELSTGIDVADVGCGSGRALCILGAAFPNSRFVGFDMSAKGIEAAQAQAANLPNVTFELADASALNQHERFDLVTTFDAIHDQAQPEQVLAGIHQMLKPGGSYLCVEPKASSVLAENLAEPMAPYMYTISTMHCMTVSLAYGGEGLGTAWGHQTATEYIRRAGFENIEITGVKDDRSNSYFISRRAK
ncbi:MAG TPA: hypothetical protein DCP89_07715 [Acidimicrobiaceae bacterium]|jgi:2-polyprenyl-3-methyl-5-hydroxy-6-metoxy-1,4-benzoquinol methylase|nr:hypothetical protein [Actinomycetota bacterium]HAN08376.1 hypothetical protein [Acidimicrobiaceae bacterium]